MRVGYLGEAATATGFFGLFAICRVPRKLVEGWAYNFRVEKRLIYLHKTHVMPSWGGVSMKALLLWFFPNLSPFGFRFRGRVVYPRWRSPIFHFVPYRYPALRPVYSDLVLGCRLRYVLWLPSVFPVIPVPSSRLFGQP